MRDTKQTQVQDKPNQCIWANNKITVLPSRLATSPDPKITSPFYMDPKLLSLACSLYCLEKNLLEGKDQTLSGS